MEFEYKYKSIISLGGCALVKKKRKLNHSIIDDSKTQSAIVGNLKRVFSRSPQIRAYLKQYRIEEPWFKKDGTKAKKPRVWFVCHKCGDKFNSNNVQVDHIEPVVPLNIPSKHLSYDVLINRLFCDNSNLQVLCKKHHKEKSEEENRIRKEWITKTKYIVYETVNRLNGKRYIGVHKCIDYDDGYLGSGTAFRSALSKYGRENFYRIVLAAYDNADDAIRMERELVTENVVKSGIYYNLALGGVYDKGPSTSPRKGIICHQTGEIFESVSAAAESIGISASSISKALDDPTYPVRNLHFFTVDTYKKSTQVSYPKIGRDLVCLNNREKYPSIRSAAESLSLNYKSLRNALIEKDENEVYSLSGYYFLYSNEFDEDKRYAILKKKVRCVELDKTFDTCIQAAMFLKHKKPDFAGIAIGRAIRQKKRMYKYTWECIYEKEEY